MKIVFDHQIFGWQKFGGVSRYIYELSSKLSTNCSDKVSILCPLFINRYLDSAPDTLNVLGIPIPKIPKTGRIYRFVNLLIAWPILRFLKPDIVHETYYSRRRIAPKGTKIILTVHDMIHERFKDDFSLLDRTAKDKAAAVERADHIICVSEHTRTDLIDLLGVNPNKISVVYHGFGLTSQQPSMPGEEYINRPFFLYVGGRVGYKNFEGLLRAFADSNFLKSNFDIVCFGGGGFTSKELKMMRELSIDSNLVHQVSGNDNLLAGFYKTATAFVYPSLYEGFGIPLLEAMSFDCPVVCSKDGPMPEVVGDAALMFDPNDVKSIQSALEDVVTNKELTKKLISRGRKNIRKFSWERCAKETFSVYQRALLSDKF